VNPGGGPAISYNDVWWNLTNYSGCSPGEGDISANPLFCDPESDNFYLHSSSPCHRAGEGDVDIGAFGVGCGWVIVIPGCDQGGPPNTQVSVSFYVENLQDSADTFDLNVSDQLGWSIEPAHYEVFLDSFQVDTVGFTVSIPDVPLGTKDDICLRAIPRNSPSDSYSGCLHVICDSYNIKISDISDVGNDQGRQVRIEWFSFPGSDPLVINFTIFRRIDSLLFASLSRNPRIFSSKDYPPGNWDMVGTYPAFGETLYSAVVPTLKDSTIAEGMHWSVFFVRGGTDNPTVYFDSPVDSGYSLDNLSPSPPTGLLASHEPALTKLTWSMTPALDFDYCTLYRDTLSGFTPDPSKRLGYTIDSTFADSTAQLGRAYYYVVSATDFSGNESDPSNEALGVRYITGDANADGGIDLADVLSLITYLYKNGPPPSPPESGDVNCDGTVDLGDVLYLIAYLYKNGSAPCEQ